MIESLVENACAPPRAAERHLVGRTGGRPRPVSMILGLLVAVATTTAFAPGAAAGGGHKGTPAPQLQVDKSKVDLANHRLELRMSLPPAEVEIKVLADTGEELADERHDFT